MSVQFTGDKTALRRTTNLPAAHNAFTLTACVKLNAAAPARTATIFYTQNTTGSVAETAFLGNASGTGLRAGDNYNGTVSADLATLSAGGAAGTNWVFVALVGTASGAGGLMLATKPIGSGSLTSLTINNSAGAAGFDNIQLGDLPFGTTGWLDGLVAHFKLYNRALSLSELAAEAGQGAPVSTTGLLSYHSFSAGTIGAAVVPDIGTGTFGYQTSAPTVSADMPVFAPVLTGADTLPAYTGPVWIPVPQQTVYIGLPWSYPAPPLASGATPLSFGKVSGPDWVSVSPADGTPSGTPTGNPTLTQVVIRATNAVDFDDLTIALDVQRTTPVLPPAPTPVAPSAPASGQTMVKPTVPLVDDNGMVARDWWRFFSKLVTDMQTALNRAPQRLASATLTGTQSAVYASPASASTVITALTLTNPTSAAVSVSLWLVPANGTPGAANALDPVTVAAGASVPVPAAVGQVVVASGKVFAQGAGVVLVLTGSVQT